MTTFAFLAVLFAALMHASWNALIKLDAGRATAMMILSLAQGLLGVLVAITRPLPQGEVWFWLLASGFIHAAYQTFLLFAYKHGDLSRVYPIARGVAPGLVAIVGALVLSDHLSLQEVIGISTLGLGILLMTRGIFTNGESRRMLPFALGSAMATASYTLVDGMGARISGDPVTYVAWMFILSGLIFTTAGIAKDPRILRANRRSWAFGGLAAALSYGAYGITVWAMTIAPIALVSALRETSILFAVLMGWLLFSERMDRTKAVAAGLIVAGVILTRV